MEEIKGPPCDKDDNQTSSSSSIDMKDWDLLDPDIPGLQESSIVNEHKEESDPKTVSSPSGLFMHTSPEHSGVEELVADNDHLRHYESNSSSDIDVIDECLEDSPGSISIPTMDISFCASDISSTMSASQQGSTERPSPSKDSENQTDEIPSDPVPPANQRTLFDQFLAVVRLIIDAIVALQRDRSLIDYIVLVSVFSICIIVPVTHIIVKKASWQQDKLAQMEGHIDKLQSENIHLKNKVLSKIENGKLFGELDEEMRDLKAENLKLHKAMQTVIRQLEEQTHAIRRGMEVKEHKHPDSYKKEISKLKEQINMLRIDNEELQTQLVRIRYGKHPIHQDNSADKHEGEKKERVFKFAATEIGEKKENTFEKREEINEFRKKLNDEVAKLKNWEKLLEDFTKEMESTGYGGKFKKRRYSDEEENHNEKQENSKSKQKQHKSRRFYDWSWKEIQDNFKGTLENFPAVSDMISQYVLFDKQKVDGILNSISHYFKKAQDETKKILKSYSVDEKTQAVKDDVWTLLGEMKNKWVSMKKDFLQKNFGSTYSEKKSEFTTENDDGDSNQKEQAAPEVKYKSHLNMKEYNGDSLHKDNTKEFQTDDYRSENNDLNEGYIFNPEILLKENMDDMDEFNKLLKEAQQMIYDRESNLDTWMLERARHRAELREEDGMNNEESDLNWYLRKTKISKETDKDSMTENFFPSKKEKE